MNQNQSKLKRKYNNATLTNLFILFLFFLLFCFVSLAYLLNGTYNIICNLYAKLIIFCLTINVYKSYGRPVIFHSLQSAVTLFFFSLFYSSFVFSLLCIFQLLVLLRLSITKIKRVCAASLP